jgi:hypothetical protein
MSIRDKNFYWKRKNAGLCTGCGKTPPPGKTVCAKCRTERTKCHFRRAQRLRRESLCYKCGQKPAKINGQCNKCHEAAQIMQRKNRKNLKIDTMNHYGGTKCTCCGLAELSLLTIDHINGKGGAHRRSLNSDGGAHFWRWLRKKGYPPGYRVLCWNCNISTYLNKGTCFHKLLPT